jgi:ribonuclease HII
MAVLAGIDEAGFGPVLGPLVVTSSVFLAPDNVYDKDLWYILYNSVGKKKKHLAGRLLICDSKKAYTPSTGLHHLNRTVLALLRCQNQKAGTVAELLSILCPDCLSRLKQYPWYKNVQNKILPRQPDDVEIAANTLNEDLMKAGIKLYKLSSRCLDVSYYNDFIDKVHNKSIVLFHTVTVLIEQIITQTSDERVYIMIDRHGGRVRYREHLQRSFPDMRLKIIEENNTTSSYILTGRGKNIQVRFAVKADDNLLPVALASIVSKYIRELLMECINQYFLDQAGQLKPTAGYWTDGLRFINDIKQALPFLPVNDNQLIRCR